MISRNSGNCDQWVKQDNTPSKLGAFVDTTEQIITEAVCGDATAAQFLSDILNVAHFFDDLIDRDRVVTDSTILRAMQMVLIDLPRNRFYADHFDNLNPLVVIAMTNWQIATRLEREDDNPLPECTFIIRSSYVDLVTQVATICGGYEHGINVGIKARAITHGETFAGYLKNLELEKQAREKK